MIRTLVVDDDFRVANIHAASVEKVEGYCCVGQAHTAAAAREMIADLKPDLLLLDLYLPDEDGLSLLRFLRTQDATSPDCIFISAARDMAAIRTAIGLGSVYYLVKPFAFSQLKQQLEAYRLWHEYLPDNDAVDDQAAVDRLFQVRGKADTETTPARTVATTTERILETVRQATGSMTAADVASALGMSRPTAQRHLTELQRRGLLTLDFSYGVAGRPTHRYRNPAGDESRGSE